MARQLLINGEVLIRVKGAQGTAIANLSELSLAAAPVSMIFNLHHEDVMVDAFGQYTPADTQTFVSDVIISASLLYTDLDVLKECMRLSMGAGAQWGQTGRAGTLMGGGVDRFQPGYKYVGLNLTSPVLGMPWRFLHAYLIAPVGAWPIGTQKSIIPVSFRAISYAKDPWNSGAGALNAPIWDTTSDT